MPAGFLCRHTNFELPVTCNTRIESWIFQLEGEYSTDLTDHTLINQNILYTIFAMSWILIILLNIFISTQGISSMLS